MDILIYVLIGIVVGLWFAKKYKTRGGLFIDIITGIIGAMIGGLAGDAFISNTIFSILLSIVFSVLILYIFKKAVNKIE